MATPVMLNLVIMSVASAPGTATTVSLGSAIGTGGGLTFVQAGGINNGVYYYEINDGPNKELCSGTLNTSNNSITRTTITASVAGTQQSTPINASANAIICSCSNDIIAYALSQLVNQSTTGVTFTILSSGSGTYSPPAGCKWIKVRIVGGGGGGNGDKTSNTGTGGNGGNTTFGSLTAYGGQGGQGFVGGTGGSASGGDVNVYGAPGNGGGYNNSTGTVGSNGGSGPFGAGGFGTTGTGSSALGFGGGGAGGMSGATTTFAGGAGAYGGYVEKTIINPTSYSYAVGSQGNANNGSNYNGGPGTGGLILVEEHYNY